MAGVHALKSGAITNRDATPRVISNPGLLSGSLRCAVGTLETKVPDEDSIGSTFRMLQLPSNAIVHSVRIFSDDMGSTAAAVDIGIYETVENGGLVKDADHFAAAVSLKDGALNGVEVAHASAVFGIEDAEKPLWLALGLTADPKKSYDLVCTATGAIDTAGSLCIKVQYAI